MGFVTPCDGERYLWAHLGNIMSWAHVIKITRTSYYRSSKECSSVTRMNKIWWYRWSVLGRVLYHDKRNWYLCLVSNDKMFRWSHRGHYGSPGPANDHCPESGVSDMSVRSRTRRVTHLRFRVYRRWGITKIRWSEEFRRRSGIIGMVPRETGMVPEASK